jgi:hypothetical protein
LDEILEGETIVLMRHQYANWILTHKELNFSGATTAGQERVVVCVPAYVAFGLENPYHTKILILLTTLGFYLIDKRKRCSKCIKDSCFGSPVILARFSLQNITSVVYFKFLRQKLLIELSQDP